MPFFLSASDSGKEYYPIFFTTEFAFEEFYCVCIQLLNKTWKEMRATSGDFNRVMQVVKDQIGRALGGRHLTMENFKVRLISPFIPDSAKSRIDQFCKIR